MVSCESTRSYKIPLKDCRNSFIDHNLVTILLSVEWSDGGGDNPCLVIDVTDKQPSTPYFQQNQSSSSVLVNSVHHPHQENVGTQQHYHHHHSSAINNHDPSSSTTTITTGDHDDVLSTTTTTVVYNAIKPHLQTSTSPAITQQTKPESKKAQLSPVFRRQQISNQQYLSPQHVIQTPSTNMNDSRLNMQISAISPTSSMKPLSSMMTHVVDLQPSSTRTCPPLLLTPPSLPSLVCRCPNPNFIHEHNCPLATLTKQQSIDQRTTSASQTHQNNAIPVFSMRKPMVTTTFVPFPNPNLMTTTGSSSSVTTTIISQQPQFINDNQMNSTIKIPPIDTDNNFQQQSLNFSQVIINNQSNYQTNPLIPIPFVGQQSNNSTNSNLRKKRPTKKITLINQDQTSFQNLNNSPIKQQNNNPIQLQQGMFIPQDNSQITTNLSSDHILRSSTNDIKGNIIQQHSPPMIRSPVELDIRVSQNLIQTTITSADIDQTITDVIKGEGNIIIDDISTSSQQKQSSSIQSIRKQNESIITNTYLSPLHQKQLSSTYDTNLSTLTHSNLVDITQQIDRPSIIEQNKINTLLQQKSTNNNKKRKRSKSTNNTESKHTRKLSINIPQSIPTSSSHQDISRTTIISPIIPTSNLNNKPTSWSNTSIPSSSSRSVTTSVEAIGNLVEYFKNGSWPTPDIDHNNSIYNHCISNDEQEQILNPMMNHYEDVLDAVFSSKTDERFDSSTPPPLPLPMSELMTNQILTPASTEKSSSTSISSLPNLDDVYENYFPSRILSSSSTWQENQLASSVIRPPNLQNNNLAQQQYYSQTDKYFDSNLQSQIHTSQIIETNSNTVNQMNNNGDVQTSPKKQQQQQQQKQKSSKKTNHQSNSINNKSLKHSSKISKQQNKFNSIQKKTSTKPSCTRCGLTQLIDITHHEFPKQKGLVFECVSCGNNSIRSNVSADERRRRLAKVAADHLSTVECQFCHKIFHSHKDYLTHLQKDHSSNKLK